MKSPKSTFIDIQSQMIINLIDGKVEAETKTRLLEAQILTFKHKYLNDKSEISKLFDEHFGIKTLTHGHTN